ncbi:acetyl-CoA carboxylase biotin carboxyl carrier protein [Clostridium formicaceticum]|uniref:Biotin carboxyl carrier protein of acetyl-CoA carboxylase n=1 Tax=Clostridium formicaceticum TaxID=1497 RepID=A0AAC9RN90_9CLOT|nr:acetyl-CoA carboxylase biotin carboxyl carrier protein [Clostridium formicaceticum]AOY77492.1 acetyl-CoA carboxylase, biotin carboxyl carrier protein [Clostridium formicaceticum]ARE88058.1 Biotin carboxyl carrier protein of acetyl-CoA carboxylase [Clostridium formicaceticum]
MDMKEIKDLILTIDKTSIQTVEIEKNDIKIKIDKRSINKNSPSMIVTDTNEAKVTSKDVASEVNVPEHIQPINEDENIYTVKSSMIGTFYEKPSPDAPPFVKAGDKVDKGQTLCIIEAMKMMNEIQCEFDGEVIEVLIENEDIVEYGQPLMRIRRY